MKEFLEGSHAIAEVIKTCNPGLISAYPITPQTHIVEDLAQMVSDGQIKSQFVNVESEHSAASVVLGGSATGVRVYTATSSQGLFYMQEVVFNIAGMRLPVVMTCANRAISAPINIWNDQQDSISLRDAGWIQIYAENNQEAMDFHLIAYRLAEDKRVMLPVMVCMDGFILTHGMETVDTPEQDKVDKFLPPYNPLYKLDPAAPLSMGLLADPECYMETRFAIQETMRQCLEYLPGISSDFKGVFGRDYKDLLVEEYQVKDAEKVIVAMGSVCGTIKEVIDEQRAKGKKVGLLRIISYRPFPYARVCAALKNTAKVAVLDKAVSLGAYAPVAAEVKSAFFGKKKGPKVISSFVAGLGGRDITAETIREVFRRLNTKEVNFDFVDLKPELLKEDYGE
ncbi:MAG: pyruvate ferredoxin oxidoreductase [Candidatus Omnitrophica bacterium]|nr:pyruvate ferredoxin oxidoreductase [Candidatus Omnitrophota bacterium]MDD5042870.1 pyruvate ferredoxin oxidoreductase [Candidatus Omnitrophota bacterium]MDD5500768.1 pyruvate ferredoxin oxidoreductase [Candidatus Omnitrophota bacterium]